MDNIRIMLNQKLEFLDILQESLTISSTSITFIIFTSLTSFPFLCFLFFFNLTLQTSILQIHHSLSQHLHQDPFFSYYYHDEYSSSHHGRAQLAWTAFSKIAQLAFLYLVPYKLLQLISIATTVDLTTRLYDGEKLPANLTEFLRKPISRNGVKGPLITFVYSILLSTSILLGLVWVVANCVFLIEFVDSFGRYYYYFDDYYYQSGFRMVRNSLIIGVHGAAFVALLVKYMEWSGGWNVSVVVSILGEEYGNEAFEVSGYYGRGSQMRGGMLMLVFFAWGVVLRAPCLFGGWDVEKGGERVWFALVGAALMCVVNVIKWVVCAVYFFDCKRRVLEKKIDLECVKEVNEAKVCG